MPTLEEYAAQHVPQWTTEEPPESQPDPIATRLEAEKYHSLLDNLREIVNRPIHPHTKLQLMANAIFTESSEEAARVSADIEATKHPGGRLLAYQCADAEKAFLDGYIKKLDEQKQFVLDEIKRLTDIQTNIMKDNARSQLQNEALSDVLAFCKNPGPRPTLLQEVSELYRKHKNNPAAMGLLYGSLTEALRQLPTFDIIEEQELTALQESLERAIKCR